MTGRVILVAVVCVAIGFLLGKIVPGPSENHDASPPPPVADGQHLHLENASVVSILDLYEQVSGKHLVRDANLYGIPPFNMNADGLGRDDLIKMIRRTLLLNGIALMPIDDHTEKVLTTGTNKNPRSEGMRIYTSAADLPDSQTVSYYMPLEYISPNEAVGIFELQAPVHTYGSYVPAPTAQAVILTEDSDVVRQLIQLRKLVDVPKGAAASGSPASFTWSQLALAVTLIFAAMAGNFFAYLWVRRKSTSGNP